MRWWLVAAWALAAEACIVLLWLDAHYVIRVDPDEEADPAFLSENALAMRFGCFELVTERRDVSGAPDSVRDPEPRTPMRATRETYAELIADVRDDQPNAAHMRGLLRRLSRSGAALFATACVAPLLGLLALLRRRGRPAVRLVLLLLAALLPLAALVYFRFAVNGVHAEVEANRHPVFDPFVITTHATPATWWTRAACGALAVAALAWWRPRRVEAKPVDPEVFD